MLIRLKDLKSLDAVASDESRHNVTDLFVGKDHRVTHVVVDIGSWFERQKCAMRITVFEQPDVAEGVWPVKVAAADVEAGEVVAARAPEDAEVEPEMLSQAECELADARSSADLHRVGKLLDADVMGSDKLAGSLMDVIVDTDGWHIAMLVIHAGPTDMEHQRVIPVGMVADIDWSTPRITLNCPESTVDSSPELHEMGDRIEGKWYNKVLGYYGLG